MRRIKRMIFKHFNCIPWFIVGIQILVDGEISRWQYAMCWICTLVMIWVYAPNRPQVKGGGAAELLQYGWIRYKDGKLFSWII